MNAEPTHSAIDMFDKYSRRTFVGSACLAGALPPRAEAALPNGFLGLSIDAARLPEKPEYYTGLIDFCARWGYNVVLLRLADDQGAAVRFASHRELVTHANALTTEQLNRLLSYAEENGILVIPELETFGHCGYITRTRAHAHLADLHPSTGRPTTTLIPSHPEALALLSELVNEISERFRCPIIHAGCDEAVWGGSEQMIELRTRRSKGEIWTDHVHNVANIVKTAGKELMIWADGPLGSVPEALDLLDSSIYLVDWRYDTSNVDVIASAARKATSRGFKVAGAAAWAWCKWGTRPGWTQLRNISAVAEAYRTLEPEASPGFFLTNWVPTRFLPGAIFDGIAYAARAWRPLDNESGETPFAEFVRRHYETEWTPDWQFIFEQCYLYAPIRPGCAPLAGGRLLRAPWSSTSELRDVLNRATSADPFADIVQASERAGATVQRNHQDYAAFHASILYLHHIVWRENAVIRAASQSLSALQAAIAEIAEKDEQLRWMLLSAWDAYRPADSPMRHSAVGFQPVDNVVGAFHNAASYSSRLAAAPDEVAAIIADIEPTR